MRRLVEPALLLGLALSAGTAQAGIEKLESCGHTWGGGVVALGRGAFNDVTVTGFGIDLATSVDTTAAGTTLSVLSRKNGFGSNIVLRLVPPAVGDRVVGAKVNLHFFGGGVETFNVGVAAGPTVTSVALVPGAGVSTSGGTTRITSVDPHVVVLKGKNLDALLLDTSAVQSQGLHDMHVVLQLPDELRVSFTSAAGERDFGSGLFDVALAVCGQVPPPFSLAFTVFDPPRTPTPTPTATPTRTPTPPKFAPIHVTPGLHPPPFGPTPTPTLVPFKPR